MDYSILEYAWIFIIYSFLGWCVEVSFHAVTSGKFVNRGFLNGPVTPIYGFGMSILIFFLGSLVDNFIILFLGSFVLTSILEYITGYILEKIFDTRWWDYSHMPFNLKGYISLSFSIVWGLGAVFMLNIVHPLINRFISLFDNLIGNILLAVFLLYFLADFIVTVLGIININRHIGILDEMAASLRTYSDDIGENIYKGMATAVKTRRTIHSKIEDSKAELESTREKRREEILKLEKEYNKLRKNRGYVHRRLEKAFLRIRERVTEFKEEKEEK